MPAGTITDEDTAPAARHNLFNRHPRLTTLAVYSLIALALVLVDFGAARLLIERPGFRVPHHWHHHGLDPLYSKQHSQFGLTHVVTTNSLGLRDSAARRVRSQSSSYRLLFLGDSFTEGVGVDYERTFVGRIGSMLPDVETLNAGVVSYSPHLYFRKLEFLVERQGLKIDEVTVFIDLSDPQDEILYRDLQPRSQPMLAWRDGLRLYLRWNSYLYYAIDNQRLLREYGRPADGVIRGLPP